MQTLAPTHHPRPAASDVETALINGDALRLDILLAAGHQLSEIQNIAESLLQRTPEKNSIVNLTLKETTRWWRVQAQQNHIRNTLQRAFELNAPSKTEELVDAYLNWGGKIQHIIDYLKQSRLPNTLEKKVRFLDAVRRTLIVTERNLTKAPPEYQPGEFLSCLAPITTTQAKHPIEEAKELFSRLLLQADAAALLHAACQDNLKELVVDLVKRGAAINSPFPGTGATPLHTAAYMGNIAIMEWLLANGAKVNAETHTIEDSEKKRKVGKETALHLASSQGCFDAAKLLLAQGADKEASSAVGYTPLHYACDNGHLSVARLLLEQGVYVNAVNIRSVTPLHNACLKGNVPLVKLLMSHGADPTHVDNYGETPVQAALKAGKHKEFAALFSKHPAINKMLDQGLPLSEILNNLRTEPSLLFSDTNSTSPSNPLQAVFLLGDQLLAKSLAAMMTPQAYRAALEELSQDYPIHNFALLTDMSLKVKPDIVYKLSRRLPVPPVPPLEKETLLAVFHHAEFLFAEKFSEIPFDNVAFDNEGNLWKMDKITGATSQKPSLEYQELKQVHFDALKIDKSGNITIPYVVMKIGRAMFPIKVFPKDGTIRVQVNVAMLLTLFESINFSRPKEPGYRDPKYLVDAGENPQEQPLHTPPEELFEGLRTFVHNIRFRIPYTGTPAKENTDALESWYAYLESLVAHIVRISILEDAAAKEKKEPDPTPSAASVITCATAGLWCGTRYLDDSQFLYDTKMGIAKTFQEQVLAFIDALKVGIAERMVDKSDPHNVHRFNKILQVIDEAAGIPQSEKSSRYYFNDPIAPQLNDADLIQRNFWGEFNPTAILNVVSEPINKKNGVLNEELVFQWFKDNVPPEWEKGKYERILAELSKLPTKREKAKALEEHYAIIVNPVDLESDQQPNWEKILEQDRASSYFVKEVIHPQTGKYKRTAIIYMLTRLGVF